jgi:hypothetical protein
MESRFSCLFIQALKAHTNGPGERIKDRLWQTNRRIRIKEPLLSKAVAVHATVKAAAVKDGKVAVTGRGEGDVPGVAAARCAVSAPTRPWRSITRMSGRYKAL